MQHAPSPIALSRPILSRLAPPLLAAAVTLLLGAIGTPQPGAWQLLDSLGLAPLTGLLFAGAAGLLACHLAQTSAPPARPAADTALPAALIAAALPGPGSAALLVPLLLVAPRIRRPRATDLPALVGTATGVAAAWLGSPLLGTFGALTMLAAAALAIRRAARCAANDDAPPALWSLPEEVRYARQRERTSSPGLGE
ncbi:hypothetical protein RZN05_11680 [Sphingomonas sp. HF-S4]|uniref:Uncharacterized protein n=1 Tax=Sphingomonas agrestis TaxID=3080540 RepID=A0ABU3Y966_9SPHN|nr:hypothetical protein [Sphingomonas sp. HF-S4]MDV3457647.1 hypothetical protein [Sphingomonas sp. HF-S4]